jgi:hypothetical protein
MARRSPSQANEGIEFAVQQMQNIVMVVYLQMLLLAIIMGLTLTALIVSVVVLFTDPAAPDPLRRRASRYSSGSH